MVTEHSHLTNEELVGVAFSVVSPDDTLAFELLMRLEAALEAFPSLKNWVFNAARQEEPA
jgi:hypothetical protein